MPTYNTRIISLNNDNYLIFRNSRKYYLEDFEIKEIFGEKRKKHYRPQKGQTISNYNKTSISFWTHMCLPVCQPGVARVHQKKIFFCFGQFIFVIERKNFFGSRINKFKFITLWQKNKITTMLIFSSV